MTIIHSKYPLKTERRQKGQEIIKQIVARFIVEELSESASDFGIITVTEVKISSDMSYCDIYVSSLKNEDTLTKFLAESAGEIQKMLGKSLAVVKIPRIRFRYDDTGKESFKVYQKIQDL